MAETRIAETTKIKKTPVLPKCKMSYRARFAENRKFCRKTKICISINAIKDDQANAQITMAKADVGQSPPPSKPKYRKLEDKLAKAHEEHVSGVIDTN